VSCAASVDNSRNVESFAVGRDSGDAGGDAQANVGEPTQLLHHGIDLLGICPLGIEDRLCIVEDYEHLLGR
jgi:hypothetical protein